MERKIIKLSTSTHVISLPASWLRKRKLQKGDKVSIEEKDSALILNASGQDSGKQARLDVTGLNKQMAWRYLDAAYEAGYDSIVIKRKNQDYLSKAGKYFPGFMIYEESKDRILLKDISKETKDIDKILSRIFNMILSLTDDSLQMLEEKDTEGLKKIKKRDTTINSYISYLKRQVAKFGGDPNTNTFVKLLEMTTDSICEYVTEKPDAKQLNLLGDVFRLMQKLYFRFDQKTLLAFNRKRKTLDIPDVTPMLFDIEETIILLKIRSLSLE